MPSEPAKPSGPRRPTFFRAFLPFWITLIWSAVVLMWSYHVRHAERVRLTVRVTVEGAQPDEGFSVEVDGHRHSLDRPVPIGSAQIRISAPDTEVVSLDRFIWYGVTDLGSVDLRRSHGTLSAQVVPMPDSYELAGKRGGWTNTTGTFTDVPTGRYTLTTRFGSLSEQTETVVKRNETTRVGVAAKIGALELSAEPDEGDFELMPVASTGYWRGKFPTHYPRLPEGSYRLIAHRPGYKRGLELEVRRNETNRFVVKFVYGSAEITTTPVGARILWEGTEIGNAPQTLTNVVPGTYQVEARLAGYDSTSMAVKVDGETTAKATFTLTNTRYRESMEGARLNLDLKRYGQAVQFLEAALAALPGDAAAMGLLPGTRAHALRDRAEELAQRGEFDAALEALDTALKDVPGDSETTALQAKFRTAKTEAQFLQLIASAKAAADRRDFQKALDLLSEAKTVFPDRPELAGLESSFQQGLSKMVADAVEQRRLDEIAERPRQFKAAWEQAFLDEADAESFELHKWRTARSATEVRAALVRIGGAEAKFKVSELNQRSVNVFTAKLGEVVSFLKLGYYERVGVVTYGEGNTQIFLKVLEGPRDISASAKLFRMPALKIRAEELRVALAKELGADVKPSP